ncbi:GntR family transcriptional regulator [Bifidobacterium biavatii]|uniref:GntR family transcriptional regulator n=1 Tax=Bifidobacterium biavatii DSM 23969 TaxID=1437608 RepID=A0A087A1Y8_9BIFI|nr:GntR family transcriptional regulator [Bifidobacterium biavatii]KFI52788.1 GntR family transcriptional regulator [Bifidobacterium biavatii DSM 23969]
MHFDDSSGEPLFRQVANQLGEAIVAGTYREGDQVPSTTEISTAYRINPATVLKGMNLLVEQGLLEKRRGLGMFVTMGAQRRAKDARREAFLAESVPRFIDEAKRLGIAADELAAIITKGYRS